MPSRRSRLIIFAQNIYFENVRKLLPIQREFYLTMLTERKEKILDYSLELLMEQEMPRVRPCGPLCGLVGAREGKDSTLAG